MAGGPSAQACRGKGDRHRQGALNGFSVGMQPEEQMARGPLEDEGTDGQKPGLSFSPLPSHKVLSLCERNPQQATHGNSSQEEGDLRGISRAQQQVAARGPGSGKTPTASARARMEAHRVGGRVSHNHIRPGRAQSPLCLNLSCQFC